MYFLYFYTMKAILSFSALLMLSYSCNNTAPKTENRAPIDTNTAKIIDTVPVAKDSTTQILPPPTIQEFMAPKIDPIYVDIDDVPPPIITDMRLTEDVGYYPYETGVGVAAEISNEDPIYDNPEVRPEFKPSQQLNQFINDNLTYPDDALEMGITGVTHVSFVIEKDGSITNVKILKSSGHAQLDSEAKRVIRKMPLWSPGKMNGIIVRCRATLPIHFEITD